LALSGLRRHAAHGAVQNDSQGNSIQFRVNGHTGYLELGISDRTSHQDRTAEGAFTQGGFARRPSKDRSRPEGYLFENERRISAIGLSAIEAIRVEQVDPRPIPRWTFSGSARFSREDPQDASTEEGPAPSSTGLSFYPRQFECGPYNLGAAADFASHDETVLSPRRNQIARPMKPSRNQTGLPMALVKDGGWAMWIFIINVIYQRACRNFLASMARHQHRWT
jgi:hypothetical protein